jgi:hypothetical protein
MSARLPLLCILLILILVAPAPALVPPGRITVYSTPSGANACVDTTDCDYTSATFTASGNAWHTVVVTQPGFLQWSEQVYVVSDQTAVVNAVLETNPSTTGVQVYVYPGSGTVCIDNSQCRVNVGSISSTSSTQFAGVSAGYHTISVDSTDSYADYSTQVYVTMGRFTTVNINLVPLGATATPVTPVPPAMGTVRVYVDHLGSTVCIDNRNCRDNVGGEPGPGTGTTLFESVTADSLHTVTVLLDGYLPYSSQIVVTKDLVNTVDVTLQPLAASTTQPVPTETATPPPATPVYTPPTPIPPTKAGPAAVPLLGALAVCGAVLLCRKRQR